VIAALVHIARPDPVGGAAGALDAHLVEHAVQIAVGPARAAIAKVKVRWGRSRRCAARLHVVAVDLEAPAAGAVVGVAQVIPDAEREIGPGVAPSAIVEVQGLGPVSVVECEDPASAVPAHDRIFAVDAAPVQPHADGELSAHRELALRAEIDIAVIREVEGCTNLTRRTRRCRRRAVAQRVVGIGGDIIRKPVGLVHVPDRREVAGPHGAVAGVSTLILIGDIAPAGPDGRVLRQRGDLYPDVGGAVRIKDFGLVVQFGSRQQAVGPEAEIIAIAGIEEAGVAIRIGGTQFHQRRKIGERAAAREVGETDLQRVAVRGLQRGEVGRRGPGDAVRV